MPIVLVTGGSRGIGAAVCRLAARDGWDVSVNYTSDASAAAEVVAVVEAAGRRAVAIKADVSDPAEVELLFEETEKALGPIDGLVNSAGITGLVSPLAEARAETIARTMDINVNGTLYCCREAARRMSTRGGAIVNLSSAAANLGSPGEFVWYAASKGAVDSLTIGLSKELGPQGIRVNAVAPGLIETDIHASAGAPERVARLVPLVPLGRSGSAEETAEPIVWLLSPAASYVTGSVIRVAGGR